MDSQHFYGVIMAGGGGTRLWPFSRRDRPKQMVRLGDQRTLFQQAVDRLTPIMSIECIYVVTVAEQARMLHEQYPELPWENFLIEPAPRGTASVVGLAALALRQVDPEATMAVVTADHLIQNVDYFHQVLASAHLLANQGYLVTLGVHPTFPSTGYGYVQRGESITYAGKDAAYRVVKFHEKPDARTAARFLAEDDFDWNSGMFIWRADRIWNEFETLMPDLFGHLQIIQAAWQTSAREVTLREHWLAIHSQTIDYGIMERADQVAVIPAEGLGWNDVGAWDSLYDVFAADEQGNIVVDAKHVGIDSSGTLVISEKPDRLVVTIGAKDLIVVETEDALLVCSREQAQKVRELVELLRKGDPAALENLYRHGEEPGKYL
jgi:mannose-1-phosphate guanylyltransferase